MMKETFQCIKQVWYILSVREGIKTGDIFAEEGEEFCPRAFCLRVGKVRAKLIWIQRVIKGLSKRNFEKRILYVFSID